MKTVFQAIYIENQVLETKETIRQFIKKTLLNEDMAHYLKIWKFKPEDAEQHLLEVQKILWASMLGWVIAYYYHIWIKNISKVSD